MIGSKTVVLLLLRTWKVCPGQFHFAVFKDGEVFMKHAGPMINDALQKKFSVEEIDVLFSRDYDENSVTAGVFAVEFVPYYGADLEVNFAGDPLALAYILQQREQDGSKILGITTHYYYN